MQTTPSCTKASRYNNSVYSEATAVTVINRHKRSAPPSVISPGPISTPEHARGVWLSQTTPSCSIPNRYNALSLPSTPNRLPLPTSEATNEGLLSVRSSKPPKLWKSKGNRLVQAAPSNIKSDSSNSSVGQLPEVTTIVAINEQLSKCVEVHRSVRNPVRLSNARDTKCICLYRLPLVLQGFKKKSIRSESSKNDAQVEDPGSLPGKATTEARRRTTPSRTGDG